MMTAWLALALLAMASDAAPCPPPAPPGMVARAAAFGGVIAPTATEADRAIDAGLHARRSARVHLGVDMPPFLIAGTTPAGVPVADGCAFVFPWPFAVEAPGAPLPSHILPHELGHAIFIRFVAPRTAPDQYGGAAPDWLDEMAALAFEDAAGVALRRADTYRHAERGTLIPLSRLLAMPHPEWTARTLASGVSTAPASPDTPAFYATVRALFDFLVDRTRDPRVIRTLADRARTPGGVALWLRTQVAGDRAGSAPADLNAEMRSFVLHDPAYRAAARSGAGPRG